MCYRACRNEILIDSYRYKKWRKVMGQYKKQEEEEFEKQKTDVKCQCCGNNLTKDELEEAESDGLYLCFDCRRDWDKMQKE